MSQNICISIRKVSKTFKNQRVLNNINITFEEGQIHGLIGRNGSGKTVLIKCICGIMSMDEGEITVMNQRIGKDIDFPQRTGVIIENPGFLPGYSGYANLKFLASLQNKISKEDIRSIMGKVRLEPSDRKHVGKYSLGMRQRLGLAQALMENPSLIILDEPMNGLDNEGVNEMRDIFKQLRSEGKTMIIASHSKEDIAQLCDTVSLMDKGVLIRQ